MKRFVLKSWKGWPTDLAGAGACVALTLAAVFLAFTPLRARHADLAAKQDRLNVRRRRSSGLERSVIAMKGQLAEAQKALAKSELQLESAERVNHRVARVTEVATGCGLKIHDVQLGRNSSTQRYTAVPICLAGVGTYRKCVVFLRKLNEAFADTGVKALELSAAPVAPSEARFRFELVWYAAPAGSGRGK